MELSFGGDRNDRNDRNDCNDRNWCLVVSVGPTKHGGVHFRTTK